MDVMTARVDVEALDIDDDWRELFALGRGSAVFAHPRV